MGRLGAGLRWRRFTDVGVGWVGWHGFMGWAWFFFVGCEDLVGSSRVEAFSERAGASVDVGWPCGTAWIHGLCVFVSVLMEHRVDHLVDDWCLA